MADKDLIPFSNAEEFFDWAAVKLAEGVVGGIASAIVGEVWSMVVGEGPSIEQLLDEAVRRICERLHTEIQEESLRRAQVNLSALSVGIDEVRTDIEQLGPLWWEGEAGHIEIERISLLDQQSRDLMEDLASLKLPAWSPYMMAGSLRLRILATMMQVPERASAERLNMVSAIERYEKHHWQMCAELTESVWPVFEITKASSYHGWHPHDETPLLYFPVFLDKLFALLRSVEISDERWSAKMPPKRSTDYLPRFKNGYGADELWMYWAFHRKITSPGNAPAIYIIPADSTAHPAEEEIRAALRMRRSEMEFWQWGQYNKGPAGLLHDIPVQWWSDLDPGKYRRTAIRARNGKYVTALLGECDRGSVYALKNLPHPSSVFDLVTVAGDRIALRAHNKQYLTCALYPEYHDQRDYEGEIIADRNWIKEWETFQLIRLAEDRAAFRANNQKYLSVVQAGHLEVEAPKVIAQSSILGDGETFTLVAVQNGRWLHTDLTATTHAPAGVAALAGYTWAIDETQHVVYQGADGRLHELWFRQDGGWRHCDLTAATGAPACDGDLIGYAWDVDKTQHVVYRGTDAHLHELWFRQDGGWRHGDLTAATGAPHAVGKIAGHTWAIDKTQHVLYMGQVGDDFHVHELWYHQDSGWHHKDLTEITHAPSPVMGVSGYTWDVDSTRHVNYISTDRHVQELWFHRESGWHHVDLTVATESPLAEFVPTGYIWDVDLSQHVVYRGRDRHIYELYYLRSSGWHHSDLTAATGAPLAIGHMAGYAWDADRAQHILFVSGDGHIRELRYHQDSGWQHQDLTVETGTCPAVFGPVGYTWDVDGSQHVVYRGTDGHIHELWRLRWEVA
jgi:hypothetical protein